MAISLTPVDKSVRRPRTELANISADVKQAVEEALEYCTENPGKALKAEFADKDAAADFLHDMRSYGFHRDPQVVVTGSAGKNGVLRFDVQPKPEQES